MKNEKCPITYQGQVYESLKDFAAKNNLNYPKVLSHHRKGRTAEEIVAQCQFSTASKAAAPPPETPKRYYVEFDGVQYTSLYAAAQALGLSPGRVYDIKKRKKVSAKAALEYALNNSAKAGKGRSPNATPCVIDGVSYPSREAAMQAYNIPRITVYSRMEREGISFEEALVRGRDSAVYRAPTSSLFFNLHLVQSSQVSVPPTLEELYRSLTYYHCKVEYMLDLLTSTPALFVDGHSYIFFNKDARGVEIISELPFFVDNDTMNIINGTFVTIKAFAHQQSGKTYLAAFQSAKEELQEIKSLLNTWFSYASVRDKLIRTFGKQEQDTVAAMAEADPEKQIG